MNKVLSIILGLMMITSTTFAFAEDVYVAKKAKRYHKQDCTLIKGKTTQVISKEEADQKGLKPCNKCFGKETKQAKDEVKK